eukprot:TRINITY_DN5342_c0_g1_i1.p1 TRINITY_DN5342_c0_g1~~TRINITY_DN5342_c0_g1_i1.p1  ORF type:complete len:141 (-),score=13.28 TRINITY_DN5342_c0_g1_i1:334-756(-)
MRLFLMTFVQLAVIDAAVGQLQTGIDESQNKIEAANTEAYQCIRVKFEEYFHMLVPAKRAQLIRVASTAKIVSRTAKADVHRSKAFDSRSRITRMGNGKTGFKSCLAVSEPCWGWRSCLRWQSTAVRLCISWTKLTRHWV